LIQERLRLDYFEERGAQYWLRIEPDINPGFYEQQSWAKKIVLMRLFLRIEPILDTAFLRLVFLGKSSTENSELKLS